MDDRTSKKFDIGDCGRRIDNLISKNIEGTLLNFY
jgi:hypothetical protein